MPNSLAYLLRLLMLHLLLGVCGLSGAQSPAASAPPDDYDVVQKLISEGRLEVALAQAEQHLKGKPRDPQMRFIKGVIQRDLGKTEDALATYTLLTQDYPELPEPYNNLAGIHASQGRFDMARAALEMAIRNNPDYAAAHENLGDIYARLAAQSYERALRLEGGNERLPQKISLIRDLLKPVNSTPPAPSPRPAGTSR